MAVTAGTLSNQTVSSNSLTNTATAATGGTGPYTQQWYRSTTPGFTPGAGNIITGATALTLNDTSLIPVTPYYYKVVYTDTGAGNATSTSSQLAVTTIPYVQSQNQFTQQPCGGLLDLKVGTTNVHAAQIDATQVNALFPGAAVNVVNNLNGIPTVVGSALNTDSVWGFLVYDIKNTQFVAGRRCDVAQNGSCIYMYATGPINRGQQVVLDLSSQGAVQAYSGSGTVVGVAFEQATAYGQFIRILVKGI